MKSAAEHKNGLLILQQKLEINFTIFIEFVAKG